MTEKLHGNNNNISNMNDKEIDDVDEPVSVLSTNPPGLTTSRNEEKHNNDKVADDDNNDASVSSSNTDGSLLDDDGDDDDEEEEDNNEENQQQQQQGENTGNDDNTWQDLTLMEIRARKIARNESFLNSIGLGHKWSNPLRRRHVGAAKTKANNDLADEVECNGILLDLEPPLISNSNPQSKAASRAFTTASPPTVVVVPPDSTATACSNDDKVVNAATASASAAILPSILQSFPGREAGIRSLYAQLEFYTATTSRQPRNNNNTDDNANPGVPTPIWLTGPAGSGKSTVTRAILKALQQQQVTQQLKEVGTASVVDAADDHRMLVSYVDKAALQPSVSVESVVSYIYRDLMQQFSLDAASTRMWRRRKRKKTQSPAKEEMDASASASHDKPNMDHGANENQEGENKEEERAPKRRSLRARDPAVNYTGTNTINTTAVTTTAIGGNKSTGVVPTKKSKSSRLTAQDMAESTAPKTSGSYTAVWTLGRLWKSLAGPRRPCVLVLDEIWSSREFNLLAQFLLLPRQLGMNLTIIVITNNILLHHTRLNMMTTNSSSTLESSIQPTRIHFPAYRGRLVFEKILLMEKNRVLIAGKEGSANEKGCFQGKVYRSFVRTLVQSIYDLTKNVKEMIRFGRILWLSYTEVLQPSKIDGTLDLVQRKLASYQPPQEATPARMESELLAYLDRKIMSQIRSLTEEYLFAISAPHSGPKIPHNMPDRAKYLLLAAYLCQVNRPDRDKHLFSMQKNGRRKKSVTEGNTASEDTAFGNNAANAQPKSLRLRTFPLERMLSIFVSLITLHQMEANKDSSEESAENLLSLGDPSLQQNMNYLHSLGLLHEHPTTGPNDMVRLTGRRYWCDLTEDEASGLADSLQFPLTRYVL